MMSEWLYIYVGAETKGLPCLYTVAIQTPSVGVGIQLELFIFRPIWF